MGNSRSRHQPRIGGEETWGEYLSYIHTLFDSKSPVAPKESPERSKLAYLAQVFILEENAFYLAEKSPGSFKKVLEKKVGEGNPRTDNQQTSIDLAGVWDAAVETAKSEWEQLEFFLKGHQIRCDPQVLRACPDLKIDSPTRYLAKLQDGFNADRIDYDAIKSEFGPSNAPFHRDEATPYLAMIYLPTLVAESRSLAGKPFVTKLLKVLVDNPGYAANASRRAIWRLAIGFDMAVKRAADSNGIPTAQWDQDITAANVEFVKRHEAYNKSEHDKTFMVRRPPPK